MMDATPKREANGAITLLGVNFPALKFLIVVLLSDFLGLQIAQFFILEVLPLDN